MNSAITYLFAPIRQALRLVRWPEWFDSKLPFVLGACWLAALTGSSISTYLALRLLLFAGCYLAFGYAINDWADRASDACAGKPNRLAALSPGAAARLLVGLFLASLIPIGPELDNVTVLIGVLAAYCLAVAYSARPLRLKERGYWGLLGAAVAQRSLPCGIVLAIGGVPPAGWLYVLAVTLLGLRWMLSHQLADLSADGRSGTGTYVVRRGQGAAERQMGRLFTVECVVLCALITLLAWEQPLFLLIPALYLPVTTFMSCRTGQRLRQMLAQPATAYFVLSDFYFIYWLLGGCLIAASLGAVPVTWLVAGTLWLRHHLRDHATGLQWAWGQRPGAAGHDGRAI